MTKHERPYSEASVSMQSAGEDYVVLTLHVTKRQAADLAWQVAHKIVSPESYPAGSVQGEFREFYSDLKDTISEDPNMREILATYAEPS